MLGRRFSEVYRQQGENLNNSDQHIEFNFLDEKKLSSNRKRIPSI